MSIGSVLGNIGGFFKNNASSILSGAGNMFSGVFSNATTGKQQRRAYQYARLLQQQQYDLALKGFKEAPTAQRTGLETAGYNPMLALGNVGSGVSVSGGTPVNSNSTDVSGFKDAVSSAVQLKNQTEQTEASTDQMYAEADKAKAEKATIIQRLPYVSKQAKADYMKTSMESAKLENDIHYQNEYLNYLSTSLSNAKEIANIQAEAQMYGANMSYKGSVYNADTAAKSTPFRYFTDKVDRYYNKHGFTTPYDFGYNLGKKFIKH